ncbi:DinB family protein [Ulvibacter antarcticus]|uniref:DinB family protein n=1 Tax=Ulvibacter antarcticus TaxID=442714 RepID=A0A3L9ZHH1_9FLAO|nr:DinB family protein [Ulvibacter antarcticus]RMA66152.1 DinB family protein [Ulvibacter antarcticus]
MDFSFDTTLKTRIIFLQQLETLSLEQLNAIPTGFSNNIFWNIKHVVVTQQLLVYGLSNLPMQVSETEVNAFRKGTKPNQEATKEDVELLKNQLLSTLEQTKNDYKNGIFKTYNEYTVTTKSTLTSAEDAIIFNNFHEGIHLGYILALKHLI